MNFNYPPQPQQQYQQGQQAYGAQGYPQQQPYPQQGFPQQQQNVQQQQPYVQGGQVQVGYGQGGYAQGGFAQGGQGGFGVQQQQQGQQGNPINPIGYDQAANQVISKLKYSISYYKIDLAELFCKFDRTADATLNNQEFGELLRQIDPTIQAYEIMAVFQKFDENQRGQITFGHFCQNLGRYTEACNQVYDPNVLKQQGMNADLAIQKIQMAVSYYRIDLRELFFKYDSQRNNSLNLNELGQLLRRMEPNITNYEVDLAFSKFDSDRSGSITFDEFQKVLYQQPVYQPYQQAGFYPGQQQQQQYPVNYQQPQQYSYPQQQQQGYYPQGQPQKQQQQYGYPPQQAGQNYPQYR